MSSFFKSRFHRRKAQSRRRLGAEGLERRDLLSVNVVPQPPLTTAQHIPLIIPLNNLLVGDSDGPGNVELQASNPTQPNNASLLPIGGGNTFLFTPLGDFTGSTSFDFTVAPAVAQTKLPTGGSGDYAGGSVAISSDGNEAVVGAPFMTINGQTQEGAAYVFTRSGSAWIPSGEIDDPNGAANDRFGSSVAISDHGVVVGSPGHTVNGVAGGAAYIFTSKELLFTQTVEWVEQAELTSGFYGAGEALGTSVAASGDTVVLGAPGSFLMPSAAGFVDLWGFTGTGWKEQQILTASEGAAGDQMGASVAISGDTLVAGAPNHAVGNNTGEGTAYVFARSGGVWNAQDVELKFAEGAAYDQIGSSVAVNGGTAVIGAPNHGNVNVQKGPGNAYIFASSATGWTEQAELTAGADGADGDQFGASVAVGDFGVIVGAPGHNQSQGAAYVFTGRELLFTQTVIWNQQGAPLTAGGAAQFGTSVAASGDTVVLGAPSLSVQGAAYIQELGGTATATATVNVTATNPSAPTANAETFVLHESQTGSGPVNDKSNDGQPQSLKQTTTSPPTNGTLIWNSDGSFTYTPGPSFQGIDHFSYQVSEGGVAGNTVTDTILSYNASLVVKLYHQVLNRAPGTIKDFEVTYWSNQLDNGAPLDLVAQGIFNSVERLDPLVNGFYEKYLNRPADPSGLAYWVAQWQQTGDPQGVVENILSSQEFFNDAGDTNDGFVTLLYQRVLNRAPDASGYAAWTGSLASGQMTRSQVATGFYDSHEQHADLVDFLFGEYFGNPNPTASDAQPYVGDLDAGKTDTQVELAIIDSPAYQGTPPEPATGTVGPALYQF